MWETSRGVRRSRAKRVVHVVYDVAEIFLFCVAVVMAVGAGYVILHAPQIHATLAANNAMEVDVENEDFCAKRGLVAGTHEFTTCELDLDDIRAKDEERMASPFP